MPSLKVGVPAAIVFCGAFLIRAGVANASTIAGPYTVMVDSSPETYYIIGGDSGETYYLLEQSTWTDDEAGAQALGTNLITITSDAQNETVVSDVAQDFSESGDPDVSAVPLWIGLNDESHDPTFGGTDDGPGGTGSTHDLDFSWVDGSTATYRNWNTDTDEPTDSDPGEYYVALNWHYADGGPLGTWNDAPNTGTSGYGGNTGNDDGYYGIAIVPEPGWALGIADLSGLMLGRRSRKR